jgi:hypothetical protein
MASLPRIELRQAFREMLGVSSDQDKPMILCCRSEYAVHDFRLSIGPLFLAVGERSPNTEQRSVNIQDSTFSIQLIRQISKPVDERSAALALRKIDHTTLQLTLDQDGNATVVKVPSKPRHHLGIRLLFRGFRNHMGIQEVFHGIKSLAVPGVRYTRLWRSLSGQASKWASKSKGCFSAGFFFRNSSCDTTTTTGFPCRVMVCAPSVSARFTTSLKEFFASCSCQLDFFFTVFISPSLSTRFCPV